MRSRFALAFPVLVLLVVGSAQPVCAQDEPEYFTVSGGWSWPVGGPMEKSYEPGPTLAASFRAGVASNYLGGLEVGYSWYSYEPGDAPRGYSTSGGDMGLLAITTENDYLFGTPGKSMRPFLNLGIGYFKSFIDDATSTTPTGSEAYDTGVYEGSFFGFHAGIGTLLSGDRFGLRLDVNYNHLFAGGDDLEFFTARGGVIFYM